MHTRIKTLETTVVSVPLTAPIRWAMGSLGHTTRTIVTLRTDDGTIGYGETIGSQPKDVIDREIRPSVEGLDPFNIEKIIARGGLPQRHHAFLAWQGRMRALAAVEMACWDAMGKALGRPVCDLIGGRYRERAAFSAYVYPRYKREGDEEGGESSPEEIARYCGDVVRKFGYRMLEFKFGVNSPEADAETIRQVRNRVGPEVELRVDPNSVWSPETSMRMMPLLGELGVSFVEEPCFGLQAMARVRAVSKIPFSSHAQFMIPEVVALRSADAICVDPHECGGIQTLKKLIAVTEVHNLACWLHSNAELGVSQAAYLHIVASSPHIIHPSQGTYEHVSDDVIKGGKFPVEGGSTEVPTGPGLGVELDDVKVRKYSDYHREHSEGGFSRPVDLENAEWTLAAPRW
jgi:glucarate dehydratase